MHKCFRFGFTALNSINTALWTWKHFGLILSAGTKKVLSCRPGQEDFPVSQATFHSHFYLMGKGPGKSGLSRAPRRTFYVHFAIACQQNYQSEAPWNGAWKVDTVLVFPQTNQLNVYVVYLNESTMISFVWNFPNRAEHNFVVTATCQVRTQFTFSLP